MRLLLDLTSLHARTSSTAARTASPSAMAQHNADSRSAACSPAASPTRPRPRTLTLAAEERALEEEGETRAADDTDTAVRTRGSLRRRQPDPPLGNRSGPLTPVKNASGRKTTAATPAVKKEAGIASLVGAFSRASLTSNVAKAATDTGTRALHHFHVDFSSAIAHTLTKAVMAGPTSNKRVKASHHGKRITRGFVIGSEAWPLSAEEKKKAPEEHTKGWRVYVKGLDGGPDISAWLNKVIFIMHADYGKITVESAPFQVTRTGWGGFPIEIKLFFHPFAAERAHSRYHDLHLEPYGSDEKQAEQMRTGKVVAEVADFIEFNEPTEALFDALTSESQWDYLTQAGANNKAKGKGKGKGKGGKAAASARAALTTKDDEPERTAQLPQRSTPANPYSLDLEAQLIDMLRAREKELDALLAEEAVKRAAVEARLAELREAGFVQAQAAAVRKK